MALSLLLAFEKKMERTSMQSNLKDSRKIGYEFMDGKLRGLKF